MARIRGNNLKPEAALAAQLLKFGLAVDRNRGDLPGTPDIVLRRFRFAVFVHGCYWHGCARHYREPKSNVAFWRAKIAGNRRRDARVRRKLRALGFGTIVVWEHELKRGAVTAADRVWRAAAKWRDR